MITYVLPRIATFKYIVRFYSSGRVGKNRIKSCSFQNVIGFLSKSLNPTKILQCYCNIQTTFIKLQLSKYADSRGIPSLELQSAPPIPPISGLTKKRRY